MEQQIERECGWTMVNGNPTFFVPDPTRTQEMVPELQDDVVPTMHSQQIGDDKTQEMDDFKFQDVSKSMNVKCSKCCKQVWTEVTYKRGTRQKCLLCCFLCGYVLLLKLNIY